MKFATSGYLAFTITTINAADDMDFAIFDVTGVSCAILQDTSTHALRCSYASTTNTATGLNSTATDTVASASGPDFLRWLEVDSGDVLSLLISSYAATGAGYILDFDGTTATMIVDEPLQIGEAFTAICTNNLHTELYFNQPIDTTSVSNDFSEFVLTDNTGATLSITDVQFDSIANKLVIITQKPAYAIDSVHLVYQMGADGNTITSACDGPALSTGSLGFNYLWNNIGEGGFAVSNVGARHSFQSQADNVAFVTWYADGQLNVRQQAALLFNKNLVLHQPYTICMVAEIGCNIDSTCQTITYHGPTVGTNILEAHETQLYPNPANGSTTISTALPILSLEVVDLQGKLLMVDTPETASYLLQTASLPNGAYILRLSTAQGSFHKKLMVAH